MTFRVLFFLTALAFAAAACSGDGRDAALPPVETTTATTTTSTTTTTTVIEVVDTTTIPPTTLPGPLHPYTGRPGETSGLRPLVAKLSNAAAGRPQAGIAEADIVIEVLVEGGVGRWLAVYQSSYPQVVGPVRSLREVDPRLLEPFDARVLSSGGQPRVRSEIARIGRDEGDGRVPGYYREAGRKPVYDLMYDLTELPEQDWDGEVEPLFDFGELKADNDPAGTIDIAMSGLNRFTWSYAEGRYVRNQDGEEMADADGNPITTDNVIVVFVDEFFTGRVDANNSPVPDYVVLGEGEGIMFRDGFAYPVVWTRADQSDFFSFRSPAGEDMPLAPGRTWLHITPVGRDVSW